MDTLEDRNVVTRKEHCCFGCGRKFPKGSKLHYHKAVDNGEFQDGYWCETCRTYWEKYMEYGDEIGYGELKSEDSEGWEMVRQKVEVSNG